MPSIPNEVDWEVYVETHLPFSDDSNRTPEHNRAWEWLEKLQKEGKMRSIDILRLGVVLDSVYKIGIQDGRDNAMNDISVSSD